MSLVVKEQEKTVKLVEEGMYPAKCISVIDIGMQEIEFEGDKKEQPKVILQFEIPSIVIEYEKDGEQKSFTKVFSKMYTASFSQNSWLKKHLVSWRGKAFTEQEMQGFDLSAVLGKDCQLQIINETAKNGKVYQNISPLPAIKGFTVDAQSELLLIDLDTATDETIASLPEWIQGKINDSTQKKAD
jgi:hypothetical protein